MIRGSCLCGSVRYEINGAIGKPSHCHCSQCRKAHGAAFGSYSKANSADFRFTSGEAEVRAYASSPGVRRTFCGRCGSTLQYLADAHPDLVWFTAGTLDDDPGVRASYHIFVGSKAPWYEIEDTLPRYDTRP
jgi:hypothetical protein